MARRIVIADDIPFVRKTLSQILIEAGYQIVGEAATGAEAVSLYLRLRPDLMTMDVVMPQMSGIEATRKIIKENPEARILIISAMGQENLVMDAINAGACDYVLKPFSTADVLKAVERALAPPDTGARPTSGLSRGAGT